MTEQNMKKLYALLVATLVCVLISVGIGIFSIIKVNHVSSLMKDVLVTEQKVTQENDVIIADEYEIKATTAISDAYKKGDKDGLDDKQKETLDMASKVLDEIITEGMTPFDKEKAVYDWMTNNLKQDVGLLTVIPNTQADCDNPYGTLKYHNAVCVGYATTFRMFMEMLDIPCMVEHNLDLYHSWNLVQLDDEWYQVDIYSDAGTGDYSHFNISDTMSGQEWDTHFFPEAKGMKYNLAYINREEVDDIYKIPKIVRKHMKKNERYYGLLFTGEFGEADADIVQFIMNNIESGLNSNGFESCGFNCKFQKVDDGYLYVVNYYDYSEDEESTDLDDETIDKVSKAIRKAFKDIVGNDFNASNAGYDDEW